MRLKRIVFLSVVLALVIVPILGCALNPLAKAIATPTAAPKPSATVAPTQAATKAAVAATTAPTIAATKSAVATAPAATTAATPKAAATEEAAPAVSEVPASIKSYRSKITINWEGDDAGKKTSGAMNLTSEYVREPRAERMVLAATGTLTATVGGGEIEIIRIGDTAWMRMGDQWIKAPAGSTDEFGFFIGKDSFGDLSKARRVLPDQTVAGVSCRRYAMDTPALTAMGGMTGIVSGQGEIWIAANEGYVVKFQATIKGTDLGIGQGQGTVTMLYELSDLNKAITISPPPANKVIG